MVGFEPTCDQLPFLVCIRHRGYIRMLVGIVGLEPMVFWISVRCFNQLSYIPIWQRWKDSNLRPVVLETTALANWATPMYVLPFYHPPIARLGCTTPRTAIISEHVTLSLTLVLFSLLCWNSKNRTYIKWLTAIRSNHWTISQVRAISLASNCQKEGLTTVLQFYENMKNKVDQLGLEPRTPACKAGVIVILTKSPFSIVERTRTFNI